MSVQPPPFPGTVPILYTTSGGRPPRPYLSLFPKKLNPNQAQDLSRDSPAIHRPSRLSREKAKRAACLLELLKPLPLALVLPPPSQPQPRASSSSLPTASLPDRPTENPRPTRSHIPTLLARPTHPQGDLSPGCSGGRPGQARRGRGPGAGGPEETQERRSRRRARAGLGRGGSGDSGLRGHGPSARPPARPLPRPARQGAGNAAASAPLTLNSNCHRGCLPSPPPGRRAPGPPPPCRAARPSNPRAFPGSSRDRRVPARPEPGPGSPTAGS